MNADAINLENQLNKIYKQAVTEWQVSVTTPFSPKRSDWDINNDCKLQSAGTGMLSNYTDEMNKIIGLWLENHVALKEEFYLFLIDSATDDNRVAYKPLNRQFGFIFMDKLPFDAKLAQYMAYELGHGAFHLRHSFVEYPSLTTGSTDNLMDYGNGTHLTHAQWENIHNPEAMIPWVQGEEEGANVFMPEIR